MSISSISAEDLGMQFAIPAVYVSVCSCTEERSVVTTNNLLVLTCFGHQDWHAPRHEEDTADEADLHKEHFSPLANFENLCNYCFFRHVAFLVRVHGYDQERSGACPLILCLVVVLQTAELVSHRAGPGWAPHAWVWIMNGQPPVCLQVSPPKYRSAKGSETGQPCPNIVGIPRYFN